MMQFLAAWEGYKSYFASGAAEDDNDSDVALVFSCHTSDRAAIQSYEKAARVNPSRFFLRLKVTDASTDTCDAVSHPGRIISTDLQAVPLLSQRTVFICGPITFMDKVSQMLIALGVAPEVIHRESFSF